MLCSITLKRGTCGKSLQLCVNAMSPCVSTGIRTACMVGASQWLHLHASRVLGRCSAAWCAGGALDADMTTHTEQGTPKFGLRGR